MLDRSRQPTIDAYCRDAGLTHRSGRGNVQRWDCDLAEHSHQGNLAITVDRGLWCCHGGCGGGDVIDLHMRRTGLSFADAVRDLGADDGQARQNAPGSTIARAPVSRYLPTPDRAAEVDSAGKLAQARGIWSAALPIEHDEFTDFDAASLHALPWMSLPLTPIILYLFGRGCRFPPADGDLRFVPDLRLFRFSGPAMVAAITDVHDHERLQGLHITWLKQGDGILWVRGERRYLGSTRGGVIRLWPNEAVVYSLAVGEGIETCLCGAHLHAPVWSCMDAGGLARFPVLEGIDSLAVFGDRDRSGTGQAAAADVARARAAAGREAAILMSNELGCDIADEMAAV